MELLLPGSPLLHRFLSLVQFTFKFGHQQTSGVALRQPVVCEIPRKQ